MSRRKFKRNQTVPSLFPFLAVLICTMGAIIVLLVLVVKRADVQADKTTRTNEKEIAEQKAERREILERQENQVAILESLRPDLKERLQSEKTLFGHLVEHVSRLKDEHEQLLRDFESLGTKVESSQDDKQLAKEIHDLEKEIRLAKQHLADKRDKLAATKPVFAIIPDSKGGNGTFRRPIFVECDARGVTLQPYQITLLPKDFPKTMGVGNPLDVGLLMVRDYWNQMDPNQKQGQAYPLLVVRPTGSKSFAAARKAMKSWVDEFGYELVASDIQIKYPEVDEQFKQRLQVSVERVRKVQENVIATMNHQKALSQARLLGNQSGGSGTGGYRASSLSGGFVKERSQGARETTTKSSLTQVTSQPKPAPIGQTGAQQQRSLNGGSSISWQPLGQLASSPSKPTDAPISRKTRFRPLSTAQVVKGDHPGGATHGRQGRPASSSAGGTPTASLPPESIARTRGTDWALPSKANNSIQVRKPIKILLGKDEIQMIEIGKGIKSIPFGDSTKTAVPQLIEQVWRHIEAWGIAGVNSYWKPTLSAHVAPEAQSRFDELKILLSGSGLNLGRAQ